MIIPEAQIAAFEANFAVWFKGNDAATRLCLDLLTVAHVWDDLVDGDTIRTPDEIDSAFRMLLLDIPTNPFWQQHYQVILPILRSVWLEWTTANAFEKTASEDDLKKAYVLRAGIYQFFTVCATLVGGLEWGKEVAPQVWRLYGETFPNYVAEMNREAGHA